MAKNFARLAPTEITKCDRPAVPTSVEQLISDVEALGFGQPVFIEFNNGQKSAYRADHLHTSRSLRLMIWFVASLRHPQRLSIESRLARDRSQLSDRGSGLVPADTLLQVVEGGTPDKLLHVHQRALDYLSQRDVHPVELDAEPDPVRLLTG